MGSPSRPLPVKLFVAVTFQPNVEVEKILAILDTAFGTREFEYGPIPFSWTEYYQDEMGSNLMKYYCNYAHLIERDRLPEIKLYTNDIENTHAICGNRVVNIDPGYIARDKLVLATTKDFYHRLYLGKGIFGEVTLHYRKGRYRHFSWTYPDFQEVLLLSFLERGRAKLVKALRDLE